MQEFINLFSNRELAFLLWLSILLIIVSASFKLRQSIISVLESVFATKIGAVLGFLIIYTGLIVFGLSAMGLFTFSLVKDLVFWFFSFAVVSFFTINKAKTNSYFRDLLKEIFKWTLFVEFFINFYTFSLIAEFIFFPILGFVILLRAYAQTDKQQTSAYNILTSFLAVIGWGYFLYALYKTITDFKVLVSAGTLYSFLLPIVLSISIIPFLYLVAVYMNYEMLFIKLNRMAYGKTTVSRLKREVFKAAGLNLSKIYLIDKGLNKIDLYKADDVGAYIRTLV